MSNLGKGNLLRLKTEKIFSKSPGASQKISAEDVEKLILELQGYQVELEMQNNQLRKAQGEIAKSRSKYADLYDFAPVGYFTLDKKGVIIEANLTGAGLLGIERAWLLKTPFSSFVMPEDYNLFWRFQKKSLEGPGRQSCELRLKRKAGGFLWVGLESRAIEDPDGNCLGARLALMDITGRKRSEEALRGSEKRLQDLSAKLLSVQELERKSMANELHDGLLSDLAAVNLSLGAYISALKEAGHPLVPDFQKLLKTLQRMIKETREIMNRLRPSVLDELGLIPALQWLCREGINLYPHIYVECQFEAQEDEIPNSIKVVIFRVAQQALTNSVQHGNGTWAKLGLRKSSGRIEFVAQDNGQGFDLASTKMGIGLQSMRERVEVSGGRFKIESKIGQGTTVRASWSGS